MSFAPPPTLNAGSSLPDDDTGEDAYARRLRLSGMATADQQVFEHPSMSPPTTRPPAQSVPPPPPPTSGSLYQNQTPPPPPPPPSNQPPQPSISRAPVRYNLPAPPPDIPKSEAELESALEDEASQEDANVDDTPRSLRPGQQGFAERLMSKYGWTKGSGLGASGSGIVNPLRVQVEKQKKKPDSEDGGFVGPGGRGKIVGGKKVGGKGAEEGGKFGVMSEVVILRGMVDGMDLEAELEGAGDGGLMQEIGEECGEKVKFFPIHHLSIRDMAANTRFDSMVASREFSSTAAVPPARPSLSNSPASYQPLGYISPNQLTCPSKLMRLLGRQRPRRPHLQRQHHLRALLRYRDV